jgi:hypothetical protein
MSELERGPGRAGRVWWRRPGPAAAVVLGLALGIAAEARADEPPTSLRDELEAESSARAELEAEVQGLRRTVETLEADRAAAAREMIELRRSVQNLQASISEPKPAPAGPNASRAAVYAPEAASDAPRVQWVQAEGTAAPDPENAPPAGEAARAESDPPAEESAPSGDDAGLAETEEEVGRARERLRRYGAKKDIYQRLGVLLPGGELVVEPSFSYSHFSRNRVQVSGFSLLPAIIIGSIDIAEVKRDIYSTSIRARYGLTNWLEVETVVPYLFREDRDTFQDANDPLDQTQRISRDSNGLGDIEAGLFAHVVRETRRLPDVVMNVRVKTRTGQDPYGLDPDDLALGNGHWGFSGGLTFVKTLDPAVVFAGASYYWNIDRNIGGIGKVDPGDTWEYNLGLALSLNERLALSFAVQQRITERLRLAGTKLDRTDVNAATLQLGASYRLGKSTSLNVSVGIGMTEDAPDLGIQFGVLYQLPYRLPFFDIPGPSSLYQSN